MSSAIVLQGEISAGLCGVRINSQEKVGGKGRPRDSTGLTRLGVVDSSSLVWAALWVYLRFLCCIASIDARCLRVIHPVRQREPLNVIVPKPLLAGVLCIDGGRFVVSESN